MSALAHQLTLIAPPPRGTRPKFNRTHFETMLASNGLVSLKLDWRKGAISYRLFYDSKFVTDTEDYGYACALFEDLSRR